jgi:hypothetical protein
VTIAPDCRVALDHLQATLRAAHRGRVRHLRVERDGGGVAISGEAVSYYAIQLVLRDVLAVGVRHCRSRIRVRPSVPPPSTGEA